jgi:hypothetical protein
MVAGEQNLSPVFMRSLGLNVLGDLLERLRVVPGRGLSLSFSHRCPPIRVDRIDLPAPFARPSGSPRYTPLRDPGRVSAIDAEWHLTCDERHTIERQFE